MARPPHLWMTTAGLLQQTLLCGCSGSGRTETLTRLALNAAGTGKALLHVSAAGDNHIYAKHAAGLQEQGRGQQLRVINLLSRGHQPDPDPGPTRLSHTVDLFDGFNDRDLAQWLATMAQAERDTGLPVHRAPVATVALVWAARLGVAWARQARQRLTPFALAEALTERGVIGLARRLPRPHARLAQRLRDRAWGPNADPEWAITLARLHAWMAPLWVDHGHVFEAQRPNLSLAALAAPTG